MPLKQKYGEHTRSVYSDAVTTKEVKIA